MESRLILRFLFLAFCGLILLILLTSSWVRIPFLSLPDKAELLIGCARGSPRCTVTSTSTAATSSSSSSSASHNHESDVPTHPFDPLTVKEMNAARSILLSHPLFSSSPSSLAIHSLTLDEPDKSLVRSWSPGAALPPRRAAVVVRFRGQPFVLSLGLSSGDVTLLPVPASGFPTMTIEDMTSSVWAPLRDPAFNATIASRGVRLSDLACLPISLGWFGPDEEGRRLIKVQCYSAEGTANFYMRPIEGLTVLLDMDTKEVVEISDKGQDIPIPKAPGTDYRYGAVPAAAENKKLRPLNPISIEQPAGPSFAVEGGHLVKWANWEFHLKADARAGVVVSDAKVVDPDTGEKREVMYKGFVSELFVPYMDPTEAWYFKTYMDAGEYGFGLQAMPLVPLNDCPRNARYMDGVFPAADGRPYVRPNMVCLFERYAGDIGWRHSESPITGMEVG